jgi:hypothetical protein
VSTHEQPVLRVVGAPGDPAYTPCEDCGAALDVRQRYCVVCGRRRTSAEDPALRVLAAAGRRRSTVAASAAGRTAARPSRSAPWTVAALIAVVPLVLGAGVLIGRSSAGGDAKLIAALRAQKAPIIQYSGAPAAAATQTTDVAASTASAAPTSTFPLAQGYTVELATLSSATSAAAATQAEHSEAAKGAPKVGIILASDFSLTPSPAGGEDIIYSGAYRTHAEAQTALGKLKHAFPKAIVVQVSPAGSAGAGQVLTKTNYGSAHQISGLKPSAQQLSQGAQIAQQDSHSTGQAASGAGLPDVVAVP